MSARYVVRAGAIVRTYFTWYHAEQMARALRLNGMAVTVTEVRNLTKTELGRNLDP